jgi:hypothetical protein
VIGDKLQNTAAAAKVVDFGVTPSRVHATVNRTDAYKGQATSVVRTIELLDRRIVRVLDEITDPKGEVRWGMVTEADIKLDGNKAILGQQGKKLTAEMVSPPGAKFEIVSTKPPTLRENQNQGTRMLAARGARHADGRQGAAVPPQRHGTPVVPGRPDGQARLDCEHPSAVRRPQHPQHRGAAPPRRRQRPGQHGQSRRRAAAVNAPGPPCFTNRLLRPAWESTGMVSLRTRQGPAGSARGPGLMRSRSITCSSRR